MELKIFLPNNKLIKSPKKLKSDPPDKIFIKIYLKKLSFCKKNKLQFTPGYLVCFYFSVSSIVAAVNTVTMSRKRGSISL